MKKIVLTISALALMTGAQSQTIYDANRLIGSDLNGTARFVGMGGAMGALGGDISTIGTNPAGIGIYRSSDFMTSFGFNSTNTESKYPGANINSGNTKMSYDNIGFVYSNKIGNKTALRYVNFAFNYRKVKNFNKVTNIHADYDGISQTDQMAHLSNGRPINDTYPYGIIEPGDFLNNGAFSFPDVPWLGILGYKSNLITNYAIEGTNREEYLGYLPGSPRYVNGVYRSTEKGGINSYDFNLSFNINDVFYIGGTLGLYDVDYWRDSRYTESFYINNNSTQNDGTYTLHNRLNTTGHGIDFKLGFIARPILDSPFRIGIAFHIPTFYNLTTWNSADISFNTYNPENNKYDTGHTYTQNEAGRDHEARTDFRLVTPWKLNVSLGHVINNSIAIGAEYEFTDNSSSKLKYDFDGYVEDAVDENNMIKDMLNRVHTVRLGVEAKLVPQFSVRGGYNFSTAAFSNNAYKKLADNSVRTDTEYNNTKALNNFTLGMGYRGRTFYADLAYQYSMYKSDFYAFDNLDITATNINNDRHQLLMTLGVRF